MTSIANGGAYRVLCWVPSDLSTLDHTRWKVEVFADHPHPDEALSMVRDLQAAHIDAIERQRARVLCELIGGGEPVTKDYDYYRVVLRS